MLINSQEAERQRLSRQMHDGPAQALSNLIVQSEIAARMYEIDQVKAKGVRKIKTICAQHFSENSCLYF